VDSFRKHLIPLNELLLEALARFPVVLEQAPPIIKKVFEFVKGTWSAEDCEVFLSYDYVSLELKAKLPQLGLLADISSLNLPDTSDLLPPSI